MSEPKPCPNCGDPPSLCPSMGSQGCWAARARKAEARLEDAAMLKDCTDEKNAAVSYVVRALTRILDGKGRAGLFGDVELAALEDRLLSIATEKATPIPMLIWCPMCKARHLDVGEFATKVHHTHSCQNCGLTWRPAVTPTVGVEFLPGFKNAPDRLE